MAIFSITTIAALGAQSGGPGDVAIVAGSQASGDGGGGTFVWSPTGLPNGGTVIAAPAGTWQRLGDGPLSVKWFGATGNAMNDDSRPIQLAIDVARGVGAPGAAPGGTVWFPPGTYLCGTSLDCAGVQNGGQRESGLTLDGGGWAELRYTDASRPLIAAQSALYLTLRGLRLTYSDPAYNGDLVSFDATLGAPDCSNNLVENCYFWGPLPWGNAHSLLRLNKTIYSTVRNCYFSRAQTGLLGRDGGHSNVIRVENCLFEASFTVAGIYNAGNAWTISGCGFSGSGGPLQVGYSDDGIGMYYQLGFIGCHLAESGDAPGRNWIVCRNVEGLFIANCSLASPGSRTAPRIILDGCIGVAITACTFLDDGPAVEFLGTVAGQSVALSGNLFADMSRPLTGLPMQWFAIIGNYGVPNEIGGGVQINFPIGLSATPITRPTVLGSRGGNAALADLLEKLRQIGLITNGTSGP